MKLTESQIAEELRAMRPLPDAAFAAGLDQRAAEGFSRGEPRTPFPALFRRLRAVPARRLVPVVGAAATLAVVGSVAISQLAGEDAGRAPGDNPTLQSADDAQQALPSAGAERNSTAPVPKEAIAPGSTTLPDDAPIPPGEDLAPGAKQRKVERSASLTLSAEAAKVADVADGVVEITDRYGGFIVSSNVQTGDGANDARASFDLRVPTPRLQEALADLSGLAHVKSRNEGSLDITAPFVSAKERLQDSEAEVDGLLGALAEASSPAELDALRAQLRTARAELATVRAELDSLTQRADLTAISLAVIGDGEANGGSWGIDDAADDALSVLKTTAGIALVSLAVLVPLALLSAALWLGGRAARRRSRDRALD